MKSPAAADPAGPTVSLTQRGDQAAAPFSTTVAGLAGGFAIAEPESFDSLMFDQIVEHVRRVHARPRFSRSRVA